MLSAMLPVMAEGAARGHPDLTPEQRRQVVTVVREVMREKVTPQIMQRMTEIYAATFTER